MSNAVAPLAIAILLNIVLEATIAPLITNLEQMLYAVYLVVFVILPNIVMEKVTFALPM
jgi:hypothetical protein